MPLVPGPCEHLITQHIADVLAALPPDAFETSTLGAEWMSDALARHVGRLVLRHVEEVAPRLQDQSVTLARVNAVRTLLTKLAELAPPGERPAERADTLTWLAPARTGLATPTAPQLPAHGLVHPSLLFNGRTDVSLASELAREFESAVRVDVILAFLKPSGLRLLLEPLRRFHERAGPLALRMITTTYMGATDARAVEQIARLGFQVKVAREEDGTRLHAKAWCFHRGNELSTVYVGSSNLSHSALVDGVEWNVRVTEAVTPNLLERFGTAFEQLWSDVGAQYRPGTDLAELEASLARARGERAANGTVVRLGASPKPHQLRVLADLAAERRCGHLHSLVVAATGTGKTWIAAFDYARLLTEHPTGLRLLFVAHREEILTQSLPVFRDVIGDPGFGQLHVGGHRAAGARFNEGVDLPAVDTVLFLRPTESATLFLQQLGRGLRKHPGKMFASDRPLDADGLTRCVDIGPERTMQDDVEYGFRQIVDIALKALSPAVNDPSTAATCIDQLGRLLVRAAGRRMGPLVSSTGGGTVVVPAPTFVDVLDLAVEQIRQCGKADMATALRLLRVLGEIKAVTDDPTVQGRVAFHAKRVRDAVQASFDAADCEELLRRYTVWEG